MTDGRRRMADGRRRMADGRPRFGCSGILTSGIDHLSARFRKPETPPLDLRQRLLAITDRILAVLLAALLAGTALAFGGAVVVGRAGDRRR